MRDTGHPQAEVELLKAMAAGDEGSKGQRANEARLLDAPADFAPFLPVDPLPPADRVADHPHALSFFQVHAPGRLLRLAGDEVDFGTPFLLLPVAMGVGAAWWFLAGNEPSNMSLMVFGFTLAAMTILVRRPALRLCFALALFCVLGAVSASFETSRAGTVMMGSQVTTRIAATLVRAEAVSGGRTRMWLDITQTNQPKLRFPPEHVKLTARGDFSSVPPGATVAGLVRLFALSGPMQPGGYDFAFEAYFDGVGATGFFLGRPVITPPKTTPDMAQRIQMWRSALTARIMAAAGDENGAIVAALVTGVRGALSEDENEALRRSGLAHVMSISGLHLALVCGAVLAMIRLGLAFFPIFTSRHAVRKWGAAAAIAVATGYCILSGGEVATVRSTIMIVVMLLAVLLDRPAITMRNLAIAALIILAWTPHEVLGPSFQMSFAATAALIAVYRIWNPGSREGSRQNPGLARKLALFIGAAIAATVISSTAAGLATLPFGAFHFERVAPWGTVANLLAFPFISMVVMPSLLVGMLALPLGIDGPFWRLAGWGVERMMDVARLTAAWPGPDATGAISSGAVLLCAVGMMLLLLPATRLRFLSIVPLAFAAASWANAPQPLAMVSEDASLIAVRTPDGLAVNTARPDRFIIDGWKRVFRAENLLLPADEARSTHAATGRFNCTENACVIQMPGVGLLAHVSSAAAEAGLCDTAAIIVEADIFETIPCPMHPAVITAGMLARNGTALFTLAPEARARSRKPVKTRRQAPPKKANGLDISWTYENLARPWQTHRTFSRAARDLPDAKPDASTWRERSPRLIIAR
jgi:competence protein ComEC